MSKKQLKVPKFKDENEERKFWAKVDLSDYYEKDDFVTVSFPNLKPTSRSISIRLPEYLLNKLKERANALSVPYQSLMKTYLQEMLFGR